jgi:cell wall-associated NlpC family hydrolase
LAGPSFYGYLGAKGEAVVPEKQQVNVTPGRIAAGSFQLFVAVILLVSACSGIRPYPRYTLNGWTARLHRVIESYLDTPYRWGGEDRGGIDCSGLVVVVYRQALGLSLPHDTDELYALGKRIGYGGIRFGDLVFFAEQGDTPTHIGVALGKDRFVHASSERGVIISSLETVYFRERFVGARRIMK